MLIIKKIKFSTSENLTSVLGYKNSSFSFINLITYHLNSDVILIFFLKLNIIMLICFLIIENFFCLFVYHKL